MFTKLLTLFFMAIPAVAKINVTATLPEFAWAAKEIGGDQVAVQSFLAGTEDPHYMDASPAFVFKAAKADVLILNGMELESGWLPKILQMSGNAKIQRGEEGYCDASEKVKKLEEVKNYDRSQGDIHPQGNPHYTLSAKAMIAVGEKIKSCLKAAGAKKLDEAFSAYKKNMQALYEKQKSKLEPLKDKKFMVYHREFSYFLNDYGLKSLGSLEEVPGVLPSAGYLANTAAAAKKNEVALVLASSIAPQKYLEKFKELSGVGYLAAQIHPLGEQDYGEFFNKLVNEIVAHGK